MPDYRIVAQTNVSPETPARLVRSRELSEYTTLEMSAATLLEATQTAATQLAAADQPARIVSVEELLTVDTDAITDTALYEAIVDGPSALDPDEYDGVVVYKADEFASIVDDIATDLRESVVPGLSVSILQDGDGVPDYAMVEIYDTATGSYRSVGRELKRLMDDRRLTGRAAILSIARELFEIVAVERLL